MGSKFKVAVKKRFVHIIVVAFPDRISNNNKMSVINAKRSNHDYVTIKLNIKKQTFSQISS